LVFQMPRVPRRLAGEPTTPLTDEEEHLLSVIDGELGVDELSFVAGKPMATVAAVLDKLVGAGLISFDVPDAAALADDGPAFGDGIDLPHELRAQIDAMARRIESESHYQLLGVARSAGKDEIRSAYYQLAPKFHPDRHFRKNLGPFKPKIEAIFAALTKAHDTLRYEKRRQAYDATLPAGAAENAKPAAPARAAATPAASPSMMPPPPDDVGRVAFMPPSPRAASAERGAIAGDRATPLRSRDVPAPTSEPPDSTPPRDSWSGRVEGRASSPGRAPAAETEEQRKLRRDILARKLGRATTGSIPPPPPTSVPSPVSSQPRVVGRGRTMTLTGIGPGARAASEEVAAAHAAARNATHAGAAPTPRAAAPAASSTAATAGPRVATQEGAAPAHPSAAELLRDRFDKLGVDVRQRRLRRYLESAQEAMNLGDYRTAAAAFIQASRLIPEDAELARKAAQAAKLADEK
jgi:curved DNA-binding protein CbpA